MSGKKQETLADIVREMRTLGRLDGESTDKIPRSLQALGLRTYADRIEAAAKREREAEHEIFERRAIANGWLVANGFKRQKLSLDKEESQNL